MISARLRPVAWVSPVDQLLLNDHAHPGLAAAQCVHRREPVSQNTLVVLGQRTAQLADDEGVAGPDRGQGLVQAGAVAVGAGKPVVEVDPLGVAAQLEQGLLLGGEVLFVGGAAGVADPDRGHDRQAYG
jgi:hypothetical protein